MTRMEDISDQVDGVKDTFTTLNAFDPNTLCIGYNGQVYPPKINIVSTGPAANEFKLSFVPQIDPDPDFKTKLMVFYEEPNDYYEDIIGSANPPSMP